MNVSSVPNDANDNNLLGYLTVFPKLDKCQQAEAFYAEFG